jgi:hypothetical protein
VSNVKLIFSNSIIYSQLSVLATQENQLENLEQEKCLETKSVKVGMPQDLTVSYGMAGITANGTTIASPDSSLKPDLRYSQGYLIP